MKHSKNLLSRKRNKIKLNDKLYKQKIQTERSKSIQKQVEKRIETLEMAYRFRNMYDQVPKPIKVDPKIKVKYVDSQGHTIEFNEENNNKSETIVESLNLSQKSFRHAFKQHEQTPETPKSLVKSFKMRKVIFKKKTQSPTKNRFGTPNNEFADYSIKTNEGDLSEFKTDENNESLKYTFITPEPKIEFGKAKVIKPNLKSHQPSRFGSHIKQRK